MITSLRFPVARIFKSRLSSKSLVNLTRFASSSPPSTAPLSSEDAAILREFQENFVGGRKIQLTTKLQFIQSENMDAVPIFRVMGLDGQIINEAYDPKLPKEKLIEIYKKVRFLFYNFLEFVTL